MDAAPVLDRLLRSDRGRILSVLIADLRDFDLAEEALSEAIESAVIHWGRAGAPASAAGWLLTAARRKAIDRIRRTRRFAARTADLAILARADEDARAMPPPEIADERLRLIFTCCHPALEPKTRVALTLRTLGGLTTGEIAKAFLDAEAAMGQRLSRAKAKIRDAAIPYEVPGPDLWAERLASVLTVIYLIFNEGYQAGNDGDALLRLALCDEAINLARMLDALRPGEAESLGLLALLLLSHARRMARTGAGGELVPLDRQDRTLWDRAMISEGGEVLDRALALRLPGPFQLKAAIASLHCQAADAASTDWPQILLLYDALARMEPTPVVWLNRAAALAEVAGPEAALSAIAPLADDLDSYQPYHAARAEFLARCGQADAASGAYDRAIALSRNRPEREFLAARRETVRAEKKAETKLGQSPTGR